LRGGTMGIVADIKENIENGDFRNALRTNGWCDEEIDWIIDHIDFEE